MALNTATEITETAPGNLNEPTQVLGKHGRPPTATQEDRDRSFRRLRSGAVTEHASPATPLQGKVTSFGKLKQLVIGGSRGQ